MSHQDGLQAGGKGNRHLVKKKNGVYTRAIFQSLFLSYTVDWQKFNFI